MELVEMKKDEGPQLQNLIWRALGHIMLYINGINGAGDCQSRSNMLLDKPINLDDPLVG